jgi:hypothetical protein
MYVERDEYQYTVSNKLQIHIPCMYVYCSVKGCKIGYRGVTVTVSGLTEE